MKPSNRVPNNCHRECTGIQKLNYNLRIQNKLTRLFWLASFELSLEIRVERNYVVANVVRLNDIICACARSVITKGQPSFLKNSWQKQKLFNRNCYLQSWCSFGNVRNKNNCLEWIKGKLHCDIEKKQTIWMETDFGMEFAKSQLFYDRSGLRWQ